MSLSSNNDDYVFTNHKEVQRNINSESAALYKLLCMHYENYNSWLGSRGVDFKPLVISSFGIRRLSTDKQGGAHYEGLAVDIARPNLTTTPLRYIALFGFYLQKKCNSIHTSISMHNKHIHIDILSKRVGLKQVEYKHSDGSGYYFKPMTSSTAEQVMIDYEFDKEFRSLYYELQGGSSEAGFGILGILLLLILAGMILGDKK